MRRRAGHTAGQDGSVSSCNLRKFGPLLKHLIIRVKFTASGDECFEYLNFRYYFSPPTSNIKVFTRTRGEGNASEVTNRRIQTDNIRNYGPIFS